ncbi:hypothetical protein B7463_g1948, partial [Scytalidium lignicola]
MPKKIDPRQEGRILLAINAIKTQKITSIRKAAYAFDVPASTLHARLHNRVQQLTTYTKSYRMSQLEEESLVQWIFSMGKRGLPPRPSGVQSMANILIAERGEPSSPRPYNYKQAKCEDPKLIQE